MSDNNFDIVTVVDDDGIEHSFEEVDRIETEDGTKYIALIPTEDNSDDDEGELIILRVVEIDGNTVLEPIEDEAEFDDISAVFCERLSELFDFNSDE